MTKQEAVTKVIGTLKMIQDMSGRPVEVIDEKTKPIGGLPGFDSLNGVEFGVFLGAVKGGGLVNICVSDDGRRALTIGQIADNLVRLAAEGKE